MHETPFHLDKFSSSRDIVNRCCRHSYRCRLQTAAVTPASTCRSMNAPRQELCSDKARQVLHTHCRGAPPQGPHRGVTLQIQLRIPISPKHIARAGPGPRRGVLGPRNNLDLQTHTQLGCSEAAGLTCAHTHTEGCESCSSTTSCCVCACCAQAHRHGSHACKCLCRKCG